MGEIAKVKIRGTNQSDKPIEIKSVKASCGCTTTVLSKKMALPGEHIEINISVDTDQKKGPMAKSLRIFYSGNVRAQRVYVNGVVLPPVKMTKHPMKKSVSIFSKDCSSCHIKPGNAKYGEQLYFADCASCHGTNRQGGHGPALTQPKPHWAQILTVGLGTIMPGFSSEHGGPRNKQQLSSLMGYLNDPKGMSLGTDIKASGSTLYRHKCSTCHGSKMLGGLGPNLMESLRNYTSKELVDLLKNGSEHLMMPSFLLEKGGSMSGNQIDTLSRYLFERKLLK